MKQLGHIIFAAVLVIIAASCSSIPNKSVFESLDTKELAKAIKSDELFERVYEDYSKAASCFNEIEKAKYSDITWRKIYKAEKFQNDTAYVNPLFKEWVNEWNDKYGCYDEKVDSVLARWKKYKDDNSLSRFVSVEFAELDKEYYSYDYEVKNVNLGFRLIPKDGTIQQIKFNYRFSAKINPAYGEKHNCISTSPFSSPVVRYWEASYSEEKTLKNLSTSEFKRDYDIKVEITDVRRNGINYSISDLSIPETVTDYWENDLSFMNDYYLEKLIKDQIDSNYKRQYEYTLEKWDEIMKQKYPREYEFMQKVAENND